MYINFLPRATLIEVWFHVRAYVRVGVQVQVHVHDHIRIRSMSMSMSVSMSMLMSVSISMSMSMLDAHGQVTNLEIFFSKFGCLDLN